MKVDRSSPSPTPSARAKAGAEAGKSGGFQRTMQSGGGAAAGPSGATSLGGLDALLALQEVPDAVAERSKARRQGERILDRLEELRLALLEGRVPSAVLERMVGELDTARGETDDPGLNDILDEIDLRARVELAKLGR